jgi:hypothetical protein
MIPPEDGGGDSTSMMMSTVGTGFLNFFRAILLSAQDRPVYFHLFRLVNPAQIIVKATWIFPVPGSFIRKAERSSVLKPGHARPNGQQSLG